jgi:hypothetical protein
MEQNYELRGLKACDFFLVTRILSKIGVKEFKTCFENEDIKAAIMNVMDNQEGGAIADSAVASIGVSVVLDIASVVLERMEDCEKDIYKLLSRLSGLKETEIADLPMADFGEMVMTVIKHEDFRDFFTAVIKQFK